MRYTYNGRDHHGRVRQLTVEPNGNGTWDLFSPVPSSNRCSIYQMQTAEQVVVILASWDVREDSIQRFKRIARKRAIARHVAN